MDKLPYNTRDGKGNDIYKEIPLKKYKAYDINFDCPICKKEYSKGNKIKDIVSANFTDWEYVGEYVCEQCADKFSVYFYSYICIDDSMQLLNIRQIKDKLLNPPNTQFDGVITLPDYPVEPPTPQKTGAYIVAHRGKSLNVGAIENVLRTYETTGDLGAWGAEADISETSDGHFILMHDSTIDRTTTGTGNVNNLTLSYIRGLDIETTIHQSIDAGIIVPTLDEYLLVCKNYSMHPVIEIKYILSNQSINRIMDIANSYVGNNYTIISFNLAQVVYARSLNSEIGLHLLKSSAPTEEEITAIMENNLVFSANKNIYTGSWVDELLAQGIELGVYTVDDLTEAKELETRGVKYITTDVLTDTYYTGEILNQTINFTNGKHGKWVSGGGNVFDKGFFDGSTNRANGNMHNILGTKNIVRIDTNDTLYNATLVIADVDGYMLKDLGWLAQGTAVEIPPLAYYAVPYISKKDNSDFASEELKSIPEIEFYLST